MARRPDKERGNPQPPATPSTETVKSSVARAQDLERIEELLGELPPERAVELREFVVQSYFAGPLPPPSLFKGYNEVLPGSAERIIAMTEKEQEHRHNWESAQLKGEISYNRLGLWLGAGALFAVILGIVICAYLGQPISAGALGAIGVAGIATALIKGRRFSHDQKDQGKIGDR